MTEITRRSFTLGSAALLACHAGPSADKTDASAETTTLLPPSQAATEVPTRMLGKTGVRVSRIGIGGAHLGKTSSEQDAIRIVRSAIDRGVTFMDNAWDYNGGMSERRMGKALRDGYRQKCFLMTKIDGRTRDSAKGQLEQSLQRLQTDMIDLVQIHEVIRSNDPERSFADDGCVSALVDAQKAGKLRFIGFTGHKDPSIHLAMLEAADAHNFTFDTLLMPMNVMDAHYRSFEKQVLPVALKKNIGVLSMKPIGSGIFLESKTVSAVECLQYALNLPSSVVITGCDNMNVLDQAIDTVRRFRPLTDVEVSALLARTVAAASDGHYERFKTSEFFDSTAKNPKWLVTAEI